MVKKTAPAFASSRLSRRMGRLWYRSDARRLWSQCAWTRASSRDRAGTMANITARERPV